MPHETNAERLARDNQLIAALKSESDRGVTCAGDAFLDELLRALFQQRLINDQNAVKHILSDGQVLGSHGGRLRVAQVLGWIGPKLFEDCSRIRKIRNKMAHTLDADSFGHEHVRDLVDQLKAPQGLTIESGGEITAINLTRQRDRFLLTVTFATMRLWALLGEASHADIGVKPADVVDGESADFLSKMKGRHPVDTTQPLP